ncbi:MAG: hypothetical protein ACRD0U_03355, partial [Acidimicrobiales bacterium]
LAGAACSGDDDTAGGGADLAAFCDASLAIDVAPEPDIDFATASPEEIGAAYQSFLADTVRPLLDEAIPLAPSEIAGAVATLDEVFTRIEDTGDASAYEDPAVGEATAAIHAFERKQCDWQSVSLDAVDYGYSGLEDGSTIHAGPTSFRLDNTGTEVHELLLVRQNAGVTESFDELFQLPEDEASSKSAFVGSIDPIDPSGQGYLVTDLEPGQYAVVCLLPQGVISLRQLESAGTALADAPPHVAMGMEVQFTVR